jgi:hypothetical protein
MELQVVEQIQDGGVEIKMGKSRPVLAIASRSTLYREIGPGLSSLLVRRVDLIAGRE